MSCLLALVAEVFVSMPTLLRNVGMAPGTRRSQTEFGNEWKIVL